ncbi:MAG: M23 family metallopeptidase [Myxococcota bacterium]
MRRLALLSLLVATVATAQPTPETVRQSLEEAELEATRLEAEAAALEQEQGASRQRLRARTRALYRLRRAGMLPIAGGFEAMLTHLGRVERLERMVVSDLRTLRRVAGRRTELATALAEAEARVAEQRTALAAAEEAARVAEAQSAVGAELAGIFGAPRLPMAGAPPRVDTVLREGSIRVRGAAPTGGFTSQRGRLTLPAATGAVREASREDGVGLELFAPERSVARAAAEGRVAFARLYGRYGRMVVLDHGGQHFTVYGNLGEIVARPGDWVGRGATVGRVGPEPLYFEVRRGTRSLDARRWLGL